MIAGFQPYLCLVNHILQDVGPGQVRVSAVNDRSVSGPCVPPPPPPCVTRWRVYPLLPAAAPRPTQRLVLVTGPRLALSAARVSLSILSNKEFFTYDTWFQTHFSPARKMLFKSLICFLDFLLKQALLQHI